MEGVTSEDVEDILPRALDDQNLSEEGFHLSFSWLDLLATISGAHIMLAEAHGNELDLHHEHLRNVTDVFSRAIKPGFDDPSIWTACG